MGQSRVKSALKLSPFFLFLSCGLIQPTEYLYPPELETFGASLNIIHNTNNISESFHGYDLYYKLYIADGTESGKIEADLAAIDIDVVGTNSLRTRNFKLVNTFLSANSSNTAEDWPNIKIFSDKQTAKTYSINFSFTSGIEKHITIAEENGDNLLYLGRNVDDNAYYSFYDKNAYKSTHDDVRTMLSRKTDFTYLYIVIAAISRGITQANLKFLYSVPAVPASTQRFEILPEE